MSWLALTFISVLFRAVYSVMTKVLSDKVKVSAYTQGYLLPLSGAIVAFMLSPLLGGIKLDFQGVSMVAVALVILGQGLGNVTYFAAMKHLTNGTAQITFSSILFFNTALSLLFLDLHLSLLNFFGVFVLLVAILTVVNGKVEFNKKGVLMMLLSAFVFSFFQLASSELSKQVGPATYLFVAYLGAAAVVLILKSRIIFEDLAKVKDHKLVYGIPFLTVLPSLGNFLFGYYAYRAAPEPAKVAMLLTSQIVFTVILSYIFLRERDFIWRKALAAALVVIAALLIKL